MKKEEYIKEQIRQWIDGYATAYVNLHESAIDAFFINEAFKAAILAAKRKFTGQIYKEPLEEVIEELGS